MNLHEKEELEKCASDFGYFCQTYCRVSNPMGEVPFKLYDYQKRLFEHLEENQFTIFSKFRQGGFTTEVAIYCLWKCLFELDQKILWISNTDRQAQDVSEGIVKKILKQLPDWMTGSLLKMSNSHQKIFPETDSRIIFTTNQGACGVNMNLLIIDEASFITDIDKFWKTYYPIINYKRCIVLSTVRWDDDWFWKVLEDAEQNINKFSVYTCDYTENEKYNDPAAKADMIKNMGQRMWDCEMEQKVLSKTPQKPPSKASKSPYRSLFDDWETSSLN